MWKQKRATLVLVLCALAATGCGATIQERIRSSALIAGETALSIDSLEQSIAVSLTPEQRAKTNAAVLTMLECVRAYERAVRAWPTSMPSMPGSVWEAQSKAIAAIVACERVMADVPRTGKILANLKKVREGIGG